MATAQKSAQPNQYTTVAILLHWTIAFMILSMIPTGWWMVRAIGRPETQQIAYQLFQLHKSVGFAILALSLFRLVWRLAHTSPALPSGMKTWERAGAQATHVSFYALMIALPLTGWLYVSSGWAISIDRPLEVSTSWFGLFDVPHIPGLNGNRTVAHASMGAHRYMAYGGMLLVAIHVGAALKHHFIDRDTVLAQMIPLLQRYRKPHAAAHVARLRTPVRSLGISAIVLIAAYGAWQSLPAPLATETQVTAEEVNATTAEANQVEATGVTTPTPVSTSDMTSWQIDPAKSSISFTGTHAGKVFNGRFETWEGTILFDAARLEASKALITVKTSSARTGDATQEGSLKNGEWFNSARFPNATFETSAFRALGDDRYEAQGTLTIKRKKVPVVLPFTLRMEGDVAAVEGTLELDRSAIDMGMFSDPAAEWVSKMIGVTIKVEAKRKVGS